MKSVYSYAEELPRLFTRIYDLKGCTVGRDAKSIDAVKKDNDLRTEIYENNASRLSFHKLRPGFMKQLKKDSDFLNRHNLMDYSLLVAVREPVVENRPTYIPSLRRFGLEDDRRQSTRTIAAGSDTTMSTQPTRRQPPPSKFSVLCSEDGSESYCVGIIDIFQKYTWRKFGENLVKGIQKRDRHGISCVPAREYKTRFDNFIDEVTQ